MSFERRRARIDHLRSILRLWEFGDIDKPNPRPYKELKPNGEGLVPPSTLFTYKIIAESVEKHKSINGMLDNIPGAFDCMRGDSGTTICLQKCITVHNRKIKEALFAQDHNEPYPVIEGVSYETVKRRVDTIRKILYLWNHGDPDAAMLVPYRYFHGRELNKRMLDQYESIAESVKKEGSINSMLNHIPGILECMKGSSKFFTGCLRKFIIKSYHYT